MKTELTNFKELWLWWFCLPTYKFITDIILEKWNPLNGSHCNSYWNFFISAWFSFFHPKFSFQSLVVSRFIYQMSNNPSDMVKFYGKYRTNETSFWIYQKTDCIETGMRILQKLIDVSSHQIEPQGLYSHYYRHLRQHLVTCMSAV